MGYTTNDSMVRVDFFKESGKWYTTEAVAWTGPFEGDSIDAFKQSLRDHFKDEPHRLSTMDAVCLEPYHELSFPIMLRQGSWVI